ncbi:MAG: hypothetical protein R2791_12345 [Saprospiraceae bacterium]
MVDASSPVFSRKILAARPVGAINVTWRPISPQLLIKQPEQGCLLRSGVSAKNKGLAVTLYKRLDFQQGMFLVLGQLKFGFGEHIRSCLGLYCYFKTYDAKVGGCAVVVQES